jgi:hypothetical protein
MKKTLAYILFGIATALILADLGAAFMAYFATSFDPMVGGTVDGLGRPVYDAPWFIRFLNGGDQQWAGPIWFIVDMVVFWTTISIAMGFVKLGSKLSGKDL